MADKRKNNRRHPGVKGRRPDNYKHRKAEAEERQTAYDGLTIQQKLDRLPPELYCAKQRGKLLSQLESQATKKEES